MSLLNVTLMELTYSNCPVALTGQCPPKTTITIVMHMTKNRLRDSIGILCHPLLEHEHNPVWVLTEFYDFPGFLMTWE